MSWLSSFFTWVKNLITGGSATSEQIVAIQTAAVKLCGFLPMAESVAVLVATSAPGVLTVTTVAHQICNIVTKTQPVVSAPVPVTAVLSLAGGEAPPQIETYVTPEGITIQGSFVRK